VLLPGFLWALLLLLPLLRALRAAQLPCSLLHPICCCPGLRLCCAISCARLRVHGLHAQQQLVLLGGQQLRCRQLVQRRGRYDL
jgi:hypothetical protein